MGVCNHDLRPLYPSPVPTSSVASCVSPVFSFENELTSMFTPFEAVPPPKKFAMVKPCQFTCKYISRSHIDSRRLSISPNHLTRTPRTPRPLYSSLALCWHPCDTPYAHAEAFRREPRPALPQESFESNLGRLRECHPLQFGASRGYLYRR